MTEKRRAWSREHANGVTAIAFEYATDWFGAGAIPIDGTALSSMRVGLRGPLPRVQAVADQESGCPQPCACPPWQEDTSRLADGRNRL